MMENDHSRDEQKGRFTAENNPAVRNADSIVAAVVGIFGFAFRRQVGAAPGWFVNNVGVLFPRTLTTKGVFVAGGAALAIFAVKKTYEYCQTGSAEVENNVNSA